MLKVIRSTSEKKAVFKKGDKLVSVNVLESGVIEYLVDRKSVSYVCKFASKGCYIVKLDEMDPDTGTSKHKFCDIIDEATFFKTYQEAKEFGLERLTQRELAIIEVKE